MEIVARTISRDTLTSLRCNICKNFLTVPPIVITSVYGDEYKCGRCTFIETEVNMPAVMFETLASTMRVPCIYPNCKRVMAWNAVKEHEDSCMYRPMKCLCDETIEVHEAHRHFLENHPDLVGEGNVLVEYPGFSQFHMRFIVKNDVPFLVYVLCERNADIRVGVYSLQATVKWYEFQLEIATNSNMSKITIPNKKISRFNAREHCSDCLLGMCHVLYHKYQDITNRLVAEMTSVRISTSSVFKILNGEDFVLQVTVIECNNWANLQPDFTKKELLRKSWVCQICHEYLMKPIYLCPTGHSLCGSCKVKMALCPYCNLVIGDARNYSLEEMAENVQMACQYETRGCPFVGSMEELARHERKCEKDRTGPARKKLRLDLTEERSSTMQETD